jgi:lipopolysaccharide assembly outer membrane protein LptD (OstA)
MILFIFKGARFTTSKDVDNPEYYFQTNKVKFIPVKVVNRINQYGYCKCTLLIALPLFFFPMSKETSISGLILPSYNDSNNRGFSLQNLGYYFCTQ